MMVLKNVLALNIAEIAQTLPKCPPDEARLRQRKWLRDTPRKIFFGCCASTSTSG
jgi:hypothetical protein